MGLDNFHMQELVEGITKAATHLIYFGANAGTKT